MARRVTLHIVFWLTYLAVKTYMGVFLLNHSWFELSMGPRIIKSLIPELLVLPPKLLMAYAAMYFIIPRLNRVNSWRLIGEAVLLTLGALIMYHALLHYLLYPLILKEDFPDSTFSQG